MAMIPKAFGTKYSRVDQIKFVEGSWILLSPLLNTLFQFSLWQQIYF